MLSRTSPHCDIVQMLVFKFTCVCVCVCVSERENVCMKVHSIWQSEMPNLSQSVTFYLLPCIEWGCVCEREREREKQRYGEKD